MPRSPGHGSLFERLDPDVPPRRARTQQALAAERIAAIRRQLESILNARRGSSQSCPGFGLSDLNDPALSRADLRSHLCEEIRAVIARYEPRVRVLQARPCEDTQAPTDLRFRLLCEVRLGSDEEQVEFDLAFSGAAHIASVT